MIAVGIDVSKTKSTVAILDSHGTVLATPFNMAHGRCKQVPPNLLCKSHGALQIDHCDYTPHF